MKARRSPFWIALGLVAVAAAATAWIGFDGQVAAKDGSLVGEGTPGTIGDPGSRYRYVVLSPARRPRLTVVARIERDGGRVDRWWSLRGAWAIPAGALDRRGTGLSADQGTLVLTAVAYADPGRAPALSRFAVLDTRVHLRHPMRPGETRPEHAIRRLTLAGRFEVLALSADGGTAYLGQRGPAPRPGRPPTGSRFRVRRLDLATGRLDPTPLRNRRGGRVPLAGTPIARVTDDGDRWSYALYVDERNRTFLLGIDTATGAIARVDVPRAGLGRSPFGTRLRVGDEGRRLTVLRPGLGGRSAALAAVHLPIEAAEEPQRPDLDLPRFDEPWRRSSSAASWVGVVGHTAAGRPVRLRQVGNTKLAGELVVFECLAGEPCDAGHLQPNVYGCPDPGSDIYVVPSRVPESELDIAGRIVQELDPAATVWVHQGGSPTGVRAWGESVPAARRLAKRARLPFRLEPVHAGSAEEWLAADMPRSARISVDLPPGALPDRRRMLLNSALAHLGREVSDDGDRTREG